MSALDSTSAVIDALGGTTAVSRRTGRKPPAVSNWRKSGFFPSDTYEVLKQGLDELGLEACQELWNFYRGAMKTKQSGIYESDPKKASRRAA